MMEESPTVRTLRVIREEWCRPLERKIAELQDELQSTHDYYAGLATELDEAQARIRELTENSTSDSLT